MWEDKVRYTWILKSIFWRKKCILKYGKRSNNAVARCGSNVEIKQTMIPLGKGGSYGEGSWMKKDQDLVAD